MLCLLNDVIVGIFYIPNKVSIMLALFFCGDVVRLTRHLIEMINSDLFSLKKKIFSMSHADELCFTKTTWLWASFSCGKQTPCFE